MTKNTHAPITITRISAAHVRVTIEIRGRILADTWACKAGEEPTIPQVRKDYRKTRQGWKPFDQSTGCFLQEGGGA